MRTAPVMAVLMIGVAALLSACASEYDPPRSPCVTATSEKDCDFTPIG